MNSRALAAALSPTWLKHSLLLVVICLAYAPFVLHQARAANTPSDRLPTGKVKVIVTFDGKVRPERVAKYGQVLSSLPIINGLVAVINKGDLARLENEEGVKRVSPDARVEALPITRTKVEAKLSDNLPAAPRSGPITPNDQGPIIVGWNLGAEGMAAEHAWTNYALNGSGVIIAILDTGVNYNLVLCNTIHFAY